MPTDRFLSVKANRDAPVFSEGAIEIAAPAESLWDRLADLENWPAWNPEVKEISVDGPVAEGTVFRWKAGPGTITSTIRLADRPRAIGWTGRTFGVKAIHVWRFEQRGANTVASMEESFEGLMARILRGKLQRQLDATTQAGLRNLKVVAERSA
jgi:hypothetical protein